MMDTGHNVSHVLKKKIELRKKGKEDKGREKRKVRERGPHFRRRERERE